MNEEKLYDILKEAFTGLNREQAHLVKEIAQSLAQNVYSKISPHSDICSERFCSEFETRLKLYHSLNNDALKKKTFEYTFALSSRKDLKVADIQENSVHAGADVIVNGIPFSLKTEASRSILANRIKISKLMEARWIRECSSTVDIVEGLHKRVVPHLEKYERIIVLRAIKYHENSYQYRLLEVPKKVLLLVEKLSSDDFTPITKHGSSRADVYENNKKLFRIGIDGSVEKVTIEHLLEDCCVFHGEWIIPLKDLTQSEL